MSGSRTIESSNREISTTNYIFSAVLFAIAGGVYLYINSKTRIDFHSTDSIPLLFIPGSIAFFGLVYLGNAILNNIRVAKSGASFMDVDEAEFGSAVRGRIRTEKPLDARGDYTLHLECIEHVRVYNAARSGTNAYQDKRVVRWQTTQVVAKQGVSSTAGIPVHIPIAKFPLEKSPESKGIHWELTIKAPLRGIDYSAVFGIEIRGGSGT
ncbi:MAG TPA: hypothetical protein VL284_14625 [Thermoanaerobaculia bacterium]|nr:hypothetical protein [Thermoanaerobaculia bacterium]